MSLKSQTYNRLLPIVNSMDKSVICQSVIDNSNGTYTFLCNDTKWLTVGYSLTIGLNTYIVKSFECNESITVSGSTIPLQLTFDLYAPFFKHGTITKVASELSMKQSFKDKLPLIFLHEITEERIHFDQLESVDVDTDVRLYFLTDCDYRNWTQLQGDTQGVQPMRNLCNEFIKALVRSQSVAEMTGIGTIKNYNIFGNYNDNGVVKNIFNEYLSGVQLKVSIPFLNDFECCDGEQLDWRPAPAYVYDRFGSIIAVLYSNEIFVTTMPEQSVNIIDKYTGEILATVSGGDYEVEVLRVIRDTLNDNQTTIINPI
jgi:hypothetical protein